MDFPFGEKVEQAIFVAAADDSTEPVVDNNGGWLAEQMLNYLDGLEPGDLVSKSPLIKVVETSPTTVSFLIRGRMKLFKGAANPFVRIEARMLKTQLGLDEVTTFIGELHIVETPDVPVTDVRMGLGWDGHVFLGRGAARIVPIGFGLDIFLGGVSDRGIMLGIAVFLPVPIPLGPLPFGLNGIAGDYAHNFKPRIESGLEAEGPKVDLTNGNTPPDEIPDLVANPNALQFVQWARNPDEALDRWVEAPPDETAIGIGVKAAFCDIPTVGNLFVLDELGFAVFTPGPTIILGGEGHLLTSEKLTIEAYAALDIDSSFSLGGGVEMDFPDSAPVISAEGPFAAFFSWEDPRVWFVRIGAENDPIKAKFLIDYEAHLYFELNHYMVAASVGLIWSQEIELKKIFKVFVKLSGRFRALIGWNPKQIAAEVGGKGEAGFEVLKFKLAASLSFGVLAHFPDPKFFKASFTVRLNLPWPVKDAKLTFKAPRDENASTPIVELPFRASDSSVHVGALHAPSGRQWDLSEPDENELNRPWPDTDLVVHFSARLLDETGVIKGPTPRPAPKNQGGYEVTHTLTEIELVDESTGEVISGLEAHWAESDETGTAQLHILAQDPYSWLTSQASLTSSIQPASSATTLQRFGIGATEILQGERRFSNVYITPQGEAELGDQFNFVLPSRTISAPALDIAFRQPGGTEIPVDSLCLYVLENRTNTNTTSLIDVAADGILSILAMNHAFVGPDLYLVTYEVFIAADAAITEVQATSIDGAAFHLYAVQFRAATLPVEHCQDKLILQPSTYRLALAGTTSAVSLHDQPNPDDQEWSESIKFNVISPPSLRSYIKSTTVGDTRIFGDDDVVWNPTLYGIGFPAYRQYLPVVRCNVGHISSLFPEIVFRLTYAEDDAPALEVTLGASPNPSGDNSLLEVAEAYREWNGCEVPPDEEFVAPELPKAGAAAVTLLSAGSSGVLAEIDTWDCHVSQFGNFKAHVALTQSRLRRIYNATGPYELPSCFTPGFTVSGVRSIGSTHTDFPLAVMPPEPPPPPPVVDFPIGVGPVFPDEFDQPPLSWRLPYHLRQIVDDATTPRAVAFGQFAVASGVTIYEDPSNRLYGLNNTVDSTIVEGIANSSDRLYALWLRTPEPIDWRRVNLSLTISHFEGEDVCDKDFAFRRKLDLDIEALPSPDGSSAFLVARLDGVLTRLPRGGYLLKLSFDPTQDDLADLRQGPAINPKGHEVAVMQFLQQSGQNWPLPTEAIAVGGFALAALINLSGLSPAIVDAVIALDPDDDAGLASIAAEVHRTRQAATADSVVVRSSERVSMLNRTRPGGRERTRTRRPQTTLRSTRRIPPKRIPPKKYKGA